MRKYLELISSSTCCVASIILALIGLAYPSTFTPLFWFMGAIFFGVSSVVVYLKIRTKA